MTHDPWQPPTRPWAPDEAETQWVRSGPAEPHSEEPPTELVPAPPTTQSTAGASSDPPVTEGTGPASRPAADFLLLRRAAQAACPLLLLAGLSLQSGGDNGWSAYPAWALFAMACAVLQLAPIAGTHLGARFPEETRWFLAALGTGGLAAYWIIVVLPDATGNTGFLQTLAVWLAVVGAWLTPGRHRPLP